MSGLHEVVEVFTILPPGVLAVEKHFLGEWNLGFKDIKRLR
jgi:hypothetical protein